MSEWTWSRYRADLIPKEKLNAWLDKEIKNLKRKILSLMMTSMPGTMTRCVDICLTSV